jgi:hypothetical protein
VVSTIAERYVRVVLAIGQHDPDYVDAYVGDPGWKPTGPPQPLDVLLAEVRAVRRALEDAAHSAAHASPAADPQLLRVTWLDRQLAAAETRVEMLAGARFPFDEESRRLYDAVAPRVTDAHLQTAIDALDRELPGHGPLIDRSRDDDRLAGALGDDAG